MPKPIMSSEFVDGRTTPCCPHCGGDMCGVTVPLDDLIDAIPFPRYIDVASDGYADESSVALKIDCPECFRPSAVAQDGMNWKLVACRTAKDRAFEQEAAPVGAVGAL